jgi:hypothetical protein
MGRYLDVNDLTEFAPDLAPAKASLMIDDAESLALLVAPCLDPDDTDYDLSDLKQNAVKAVLRGAILRWNEAGTGAFQSQNTGPFGVTLDTRQQRRGMFWPSEIEQLQQICALGNEDGGIFDINTIGAAVNHADICAVNFGAAYCSCGAEYTNYEYPLYEYSQDLW